MRAPIRFELAHHIANSGVAFLRRKREGRRDGKRDGSIDLRVFVVDKCRPPEVRRIAESSEGLAPDDDVEGDVCKLRRHVSLPVARVPGTG